MVAAGTGTYVALAGVGLGAGALAAVALGSPIGAVGGVAYAGFSALLVGPIEYVLGCGRQTNIVTAVISAAAAFFATTAAVWGIGLR